MRNKLILFDYDGTLVDSAQMIVKGAIEAFRKCGLPDPDPHKVRENIGKTLQVALKAYMPEGYNVTPEDISNAYREWYAEQGRLGLQDEPIFPGINELLKKLKSKKNFFLGIATNKSRIALDNGLKKHNLSNLFDVTITTDECTPKPSPEMAFKAMKCLNVKNHSTFIVGDTVNDIGLGKNANISAIGVSWGYNKISMLEEAGSDYIVNSSDQLFDILTGKIKI